jgi:hypothetical protein
VRFVTLGVFNFPLWRDRKVAVPNPRSRASDGENSPLADAHFYSYEYLLNTVRPPTSVDKVRINKTRFDFERLEPLLAAK